MRDTSPGADDCFRPPPIPIEVGCLHCGEAYDSYLIQWVEDSTFPNGGYWGCPTPGCDGKGFCFDIWPTDPEWRDENGEKVTFDDDDCDEGAEGRLDFFDDDEGELDETDFDFDDLPDPSCHPPRTEDEGPFSEDDIPF